MYRLDYTHKTFALCAMLCILNIYTHFVVATEEENEMDNPEVAKNSFEKLGELDSHLIRHRELFLSRQVETYKIDMVR